MHFLQFSDFGVRWVFWTITLVPDMLQCRLVSKKSDDRLVSKKSLSHKNGSLD